ncbi:hypothetical protein [Winogradskyella sp.]|uniref:hypothetical protein n=1 Tax=Winogradskyella sp. TaxID=1883156 RepID=UPI00262158F8|nr:hypothetical protein [Winogradskyella sp.]
MNKLFVFIAFCLSFISCKPSFNLSAEQPKINNLALGNYSNEDFIENFPDSTKDLLPKEKINVYLDSIRLDFDSTLYRKEDVISNDVTINKISSTRKIQDIYFKIIQYSNSLKIQKNEQNLYLQDFKDYLKQNLIVYSDDKTNLKGILSIKLNKDILAFFEKDSNYWKYLSYNDLGNEAIFGLKTSQDIIDLYFDDIFISAKRRWNKESISIFREIYEQERKNYENNGIDFDKFVRCRIKYQEKAEEKFDNEIPDNYYQSSYFLEHSLKCRIYSKTN